MDGSYFLWKIIQFWGWCPVTIQIRCIQKKDDLRSGGEDKLFTFARKSRLVVLEIGHISCSMKINELTHIEAKMIRFHTKHNSLQMLCSLEVEGQRGKINEHLHRATAKSSLQPLHKDKQIRNATQIPIVRNINTKI